MQRISDASGAPTSDRVRALAIVSTDELQIPKRMRPQDISTSSTPGGAARRLTSAATAAHGLSRRTKPRTPTEYQPSPATHPARSRDTLRQTLRRVTPKEGRPLRRTALQTSKMLPPHPFPFSSSPTVGQRLRRAFSTVPSFPRMALPRSLEPHEGA